MPRLRFFYSTLFMVQFSCFFAGVFLSFAIVNIKLHRTEPMWVINLIALVVFLRIAQVSARKLRREAPQISNVGVPD